MKNSDLRAIAKFVLVGGGATAIHASVYFVIVIYTTIHPQLANLLGYFSAFFFSYYLQMKWTFSKRDTSGGIKSISRFFTTSLFSLAMNSTSVFVVDSILKADPIYSLIGIVFVTPTIVFILLNSWVFPSSQE